MQDISIYISNPQDNPYRFVAEALGDNGEYWKGEGENVREAIEKLAEQYEYTSRIHFPKYFRLNVMV